MGNRLSKTFWFVIVTAFIFTGCQRKYKEDLVEALARGPDIEMISVPPDYVVRAIKGAGGLTGWMNIRLQEPTRPLLRL